MKEYSVPNAVVTVNNAKIKIINGFVCGNFGDFNNSTFNEVGERRA